MGLSNYINQQTCSVVANSAPFGLYNCACIQQLIVLRAYRCLSQHKVIGHVFHFLLCRMEVNGHGDR